MRMTRLTKEARVRLMTIHGIAMLTVGLVLFYLRSIMTSLFSYAFGGAFAVLLIAASLLFTASADWICATALGYRQVSKLRSLLFFVHSRIRLHCFFDSLSRLNHSDTVLRPSNLCSFA